MVTHSSGYVLRGHRGLVKWDPKQEALVTLLKEPMWVRKVGVHHRKTPRFRDATWAG